MVSKENVEVLAAAIDAVNARDVSRVEALVDVEWQPALTAGGAVEGTVYRGKPGMRKYIEDVDSGFDEVRLEVQGFDPVGSDRVLYRGRLIARGSASGVSLDVSIWGLWEIRDGKLFRGEGFLSKQEALEAAGLAE